MRNGFQSNIGKLKDIDFYRICKVKLFRKILCKVKKFPIKFCKVIFPFLHGQFFLHLEKCARSYFVGKNMQGQKIFLKILQGQIARSRYLTNRPQINDIDSVHNMVQ